MTEHAALATDRLARLLSPDMQRQAARMAQEAFAKIFRLSCEGDAAAIEAAVAEMQPLCRNWAQAGGSDEARALRLACLVCGMDQWGLAYTEAFGLQSIPGLSRLIGGLREALDPAKDAQFARQFAAIDAVDTDAVDFKMELRRGIHLALWHATLAAESDDEARRIAGVLGGLLLTLTRQLPAVGWRFTADALAHFQIHLLGEAGSQSPRAAEITAELIAALKSQLVPEIGELVVGQANQAALAWRQARRRAH